MTLSSDSLDKGERDKIMPGRRKSVEDTEDVPHQSRPADTKMGSPRTQGTDNSSDVKEEMDDEVYETQDRLFKHLVRHGVCDYDSVQGGGVFMSMEKDLST